MKFPKALLLILPVAIIFSGAGTPSRLQTEIDRLNNDEALKHGIWSLCVVDMDSGNVIASCNPDKSMIPASTLKVLTTGAAIGLLGKDYRYKTYIEYEGEFDKANGVIRGNLYIRGTGDPSLESAAFPAKGDTISEFQSLGLRLRAMGIKRIDGNIIGDRSFFSDNPLPDGWSWGDLGQYYGAGACGLAYRDNKVTLHYNSVQGDSAKLVSVNPVPAGCTYKSYVTCEGTKDEAFVYGAPFGKTFYIYGNIPCGKKDYEVEAAHPDPAMQCAEDLLTILTSTGINVSGKATVYTAGEKNGNKIERKSLTELTSPPLNEIIRHVNKKSDNVYAEQLLRTLGALKGSGGTTEAGTAVVKSYWQNTGIDVSGMNLADGSGLSRSNLITTRQQSLILMKISKSAWYADFKNSLPVAGKEGSMSSLCKGTCAENNMCAKTGYINRARGYCGYVKTQSGRNVCFSLLANNYTCTPTEMKKKLEKILVAVAEI